MARWDANSIPAAGPQLSPIQESAAALAALARAALPKTFMAEGLLAARAAQHRGGTCSLQPTTSSCMRSSNGEERSGRHRADFSINRGRTRYIERKGLWPEPLNESFRSLEFPFPPRQLRSPTIFPSFVSAPCCSFRDRSALMQAASPLRKVSLGLEFPRTRAKKRRAPARSTCWPRSKPRSAILTG